MPGVPSGRGCDACRKQKKKCDQLKPACSRCARLWIPCIGSNVQRFKFKDQSRLQRQVAVTRTPTNEASLLSQAFIRVIEERSPHYDISSYIPFCSYIPQRLGKDEVLDASINAVVVAYCSIRTSRPSAEVYAKYGHALKALRVSLDDPAKVTTMETLTAIYLIIILQEWLGSGHMYAGQFGHAKILVHILNAATTYDDYTDFDFELLHTVALPVLFSSIFNPTISLEPWFSRLLVARRVSGHGTDAATDEEIIQADEAISVHTLELQNLRRFSLAMQHPQAHLSEIHALHTLAQSDSRKTQKLLEQAMELLLYSMEKEQPRSNHGNVSMADVIRYHQAAHGLVHGLLLLMTSLLLIFNPSDQELARQKSKCCKEILRFGQDMSQYRPMGASFVPLVLAIVVATTGDEDCCMEAEDLLTQYSTDFNDLRWKHAAVWLKSALRHLSYTVDARRTSQSNQEIFLPLKQRQLWYQIPQSLNTNPCYIQ